MTKVTPNISTGHAIMVSLGLFIYVDMFTHR